MVSPAPTSAPDRMLARSAAALSLALALASCTVLFLPPEDKVPTALELSPSEIVLRDQESVPLTLTLLDQNGDVIEEIPGALPVEWTVSDPEIALLRDGALKGQKQGQGFVQVKVGDLLAVSPLRVLGVPRFLRSSGAAARTGVAGRPLSEPVAVRVVDRMGAGVAEVSVTFEVTGGSGSLSSATVKSDTAGYARTVWTLGPKTGENSLEARADSLKDEVLRFTATAGADVVARLDRVSGDAQKGGAGTELVQDLVVKAFDRNGNVVPGAAVSWTADGGTVSALWPQTDELGVARAKWTLSTSARALNASARSGTSEAKFTATSVPGAPASLRIVSGNGQGGPEFLALPDSLAVRVADAYDNPVPGVPITWLVTRGGGSVAAPRPAVTAPNGLAKASWTLGVSLPNAVTAGAAGMSVAFNSVPTPLVPRDTLRTPSGVRYLEVNLSRDTLIVETGNLVSVYFSAYLLDGTLIERITEKVDPPLRFIVGSGQVIVGFDEGAIGMRKGSVRRLFVAPELGYRDGTLDHIPPNSTLVFDVQVVEILKLNGGTTGGSGGATPARLPGAGKRPGEVSYNGDSR